MRPLPCGSEVVGIDAVGTTPSEAHGTCRCFPAPTLVAGEDLAARVDQRAEIAELNETWRGIPRATDVLSFSLLEGAHVEQRGALLGDVVIGIETAARPARRARRGLDDELARLLIHGTLHRLGYDHERAADARVMRAEERRLWRTLRDV